MKNSENPDDLQFKNENPGSVKFGNFINYYKFHPPEQRTEHLPLDLWYSEKNCKQVLLDVGCNAGNLTKSIYDVFNESLSTNTDILGIDIDPELIKRAKESYECNNIQFKTMNIMEESSDLKDFLDKHSIDQFTTTFCFSVTMWIHLNYGDDGLKKFLWNLSKLSKILVIEPQPYKCYKEAVKRLKSSKEEFSFFKDLKIRQTVEEVIEKYLLNHCHMTKIYESERISWGRKLLCFKSS
ncbi:unnamed protein product [Brassicogethes aeneus]|uniref:RNA methyltransferase n=1 Tax=Brassicogethes aeneus TaxID=1431903 RepID=A0A9P0B859_BRAAE|nr:unnamed protein product [Brassicogethes aeneus]